MSRTVTLAPADDAEGDDAKPTTGGGSTGLAAGTLAVATPVACGTWLREVVVTMGDDTNGSDRAGGGLRRRRAEVLERDEPDGLVREADDDAAWLVLRSRCLGEPPDRVVDLDEAVRVVVWRPACIFFRTDRCPGREGALVDARGDMCRTDAGGLPEWCGDCFRCPALDPWPRLRRRCCNCVCGDCFRCFRRCCCRCCCALCSFFFRFDDRNAASRFEMGVTVGTFTVPSDPSRGAAVEAASCGEEDDRCVAGGTEGGVRPGR